MSVTVGKARDSSWLQVEVCRDFQRKSCFKGPDRPMCRFAHPEEAILVKDGRVICCYDFLKVTYTVTRYEYILKFIYSIQDSCMRDKCGYFHPPPHIKGRLVLAAKHFGMMRRSMVHAVVMMPQSPLSPVYDGPVPLLVSPYQVSTYGPPLSPYGMLSERLYVCPYGQCNDYHNCALVHPGMYVYVCICLCVCACAVLYMCMCL